MLFDLSSLIRWYGPPVGIVRAQQQLARYARQHRPDVQFTVFDPLAGRLCALLPPWVDAVIDNRLSIDNQLWPDPTSPKTKYLRDLPRPVAEAYLWATKFRRKLLSAVERRRLVARSSSRLLGKFRRSLIKQKDHGRYYDAEGAVRPCPPLDLISAPLSLGPGDTLISAQSDWTYLDIAAITEAKRRFRLRHVVLCYDLIPIIHPEWFSATDVARFIAYYRAAFAEVDRVIFTARAIERDAALFCRSGPCRDLPDTDIVPLGANSLVPSDDPSHLPPGLEAHRFALFVSTIEPRKNHRLLVEVWKRLVAEGIVDRHAFKLVFVGRPGWKMDDFFARLAGEPEFGRSILHFPAVDDRQLHALYEGAAFCLYPSIYEGYGLPVIEAMLHGKPIIASNGGALPEVIDGHGVCLDADDAPAWQREIGRMIDDQAYRDAAAARLNDYRPVTWSEAGDLFFTAAARPFAQSPA